VPRDQEALERRRVDGRAVACSQVVDARDVAVRLEPAQLAFQTIDEFEGRLRGLRSIPPVGVQRVHLEDGRHRLV
jgi:hypothetical protein